MRRHIRTSWRTTEARGTSSRKILRSSMLFTRKKLTSVRSPSMAGQKALSSLLKSRSRSPSISRPNPWNKSPPLKPLKNSTNWCPSTTFKSSSFGSPAPFTARPNNSGNSSLIQVPSTPTLGFSLSEDEVQQILSDLENEQQRITIESLCKKVPAWHSNQCNLFSFLPRRYARVHQGKGSQASAGKQAQILSSKEAQAAVCLCHSPARN